MSIAKKGFMLRLPPHSIGAAALDASTIQSPATAYTNKYKIPLTSSSWTHKRLGGPHRMEYPLLWMGAACATIAGKSNEEAWANEPLSARPIVPQRHGFLLKIPQAVKITVDNSGSDNVAMVAAIQQALAGLSGSLPDALMFLLPNASYFAGNGISNGPSPLWYTMMPNGFNASTPATAWQTITDSGSVSTGGTPLPWTNTGFSQVITPGQWLGGHLLDICVTDAVFRYATVVNFDGSFLATAQNLLNADMAGQLLLSQIFNKYQRAIAYMTGGPHFLSDAPTLAAYQSGAASCGDTVSVQSVAHDPPAVANFVIAQIKQFFNLA